MKAACRGQLHSLCLFVKYLPSEVKWFWFWRVQMPWLKRTNRQGFDEAIERMREAMELIDHNQIKGN